MNRLFIALGFALALGVAAFWFIPRAPRTDVVPAPQPQAPLKAMDPESLRQFETWYAAQPRFPVPISSEGAAVLVVKFTDYQCPGCAWTNTADKAVFDKWSARLPGAVRLVEKQYPLNTDCNKSIPRTLHPYACVAAAAVVLASEQRHGKELEDWLYGNQDALTPQAIRQAAVSIGGVSDFDTQFPRAMSQVTADTQIGRMLAVNSTPTFFVNGVKMNRTDKVLQPDELDAAIAWELKKAGTLK